MLGLDQLGNRYEKKLKTRNWIVLQAKLQEKIHKCMAGLVIAQSIVYCARNSPCKILCVRHVTGMVRIT